MSEGLQPYVVHLWRDQFTEQDVIPHVENAIGRFESQVETTFALHEKGKIDLPHAPYSTYGGYVDHFRGDASLVEGEMNMLIYSTSMLRGYVSCGDTSRYPYLGLSSGKYRETERPVTLINAAVLEFDLVVDAAGLFENMVIHELLHSVDVKHEHGENTDGANSPMLSGYAESYSTNSPPAETCSGEPPKTGVDAWTHELSQCSVDLFNEWMREEYLS